MSDDLLVNTVKSASIGIAGRCINSARNHHFIIDEPAYGGGPAEELTPAEAFLSGVSSCGVLLVEKAARESNVPLEKVDITIEGFRDRADTSRFRSVKMRFELTGPTRGQAQQLVEYYQGH